jgi:hypothetical protein
MLALYRSRLVWGFPPTAHRIFSNFPDRHPPTVGIYNRRAGDDAQISQQSDVPFFTRFYSVPSTLGSIATGAKPCRRSVEEPWFWGVRKTIRRRNRVRSVYDECRRCRNGVDGG